MKLHRLRTVQKTKYNFSVHFTLNRLKKTNYNIKTVELFSSSKLLERWLRIKNISKAIISVSSPSWTPERDAKTNGLSKTIEGVSSPSWKCLESELRTNHRISESIVVFSSLAQIIFKPLLNEKI